MTNEIIIKLDIEDYDKRQEAVLMLNASNMKGAIDTYYSCVLRGYLKHMDLTKDQYEIVEKINKDSYEHFEEFLDM